MLWFQVVTYIAFTLFPTPVPKAVLVQALAVQTHFNALVDKISQDPDFLEEALAGYMGKMLQTWFWLQDLVNSERNIFSQ